MSNEVAEKGHSASFQDALARTFEAHRFRLIARIARITGDLDVAEEAVDEAYASAVVKWQSTGVPRVPAAWLMRVAHRRAVDGIRRRAAFDRALIGLAIDRVDGGAQYTGEIPDDRLRLICACCHPDIPFDARVALTLRVVCGQPVEDIARVFMVRPEAMAKRLVRSRALIRDARLVYEEPDAAELPRRIDAILAVIYSIFTIAYDAPPPKDPEADLALEGIRLARVLREILADDCSGDVTGLLALMLLQAARRHSRFDSAGHLILLADQDRAMWDRALVAEGCALTEQALRNEPGGYAIQAAIAALHCEAANHADTDWSQILKLYDVLVLVAPSPVARLNRAVAIAMVHGAHAGLIAINELRNDLQGYRMYHSARAALLKQIGQPDAARAAYEKAASLTDVYAEHEFLARRVSELT